MDLSQGVNKVNDTFDQLSSLLSSKKELIVKQVTNSILLFVILLVFGCLDFATLKFHGEYLITPDYWGTVGTKLIAAICALNVGINMMLDSEIKKNKILQREIRRYNYLIKLKQSDFEYFILKIYNVKIKIAAYKSYINRKIYFLNKLSRAKDRVLYTSNIPEREAEKEKNHYCIKRRELEQLKTDEYIQKNIDNIFIKYGEVDPAAFELEVNGATKFEKNRVTGSVTKGRAKESSNVILGMVAVSMLTTSFTLSANKEQFESQMIAFWHYVLKTCEDILIVGWQFLNGLLRTRNIVSAQLTVPYATRNQILIEYLNWRKENQLPDTYAYTELKKVDEEEEEEVIEMTEEEYNKYLEATKKDPE